MNTPSDPTLALHVVTVLGVVGFKLATLIVGFLITRMGFKLLTMGVQGEFKFSASFGGIRADLASVAPGLLFLTLGVIFLVTAVWKDARFQTNGPPSSGGARTQQERVVLPATPPGGGK